ncbi:MAG: TolC family protein [Bacteroidota bacterium]|nr:TolC family protein [Bacteroidota bacterium]
MKDRVNIFSFRKVVLFIFLVFSCIVANSQRVWTLEDCINYAFDNNLDIKKQLLTVESNKQLALQSTLAMLPTINADGTNVWNFGQTIDLYTNSFASSTVRSNNFYVQGGITLFGGLTKMNTVRENKINLLASQYDLDVMKNSIALSVAGYYLDILFNHELLTVAQDQLAITQDQVKRISKMVDAGSSAKGDLLNIQAQESTEELTVVDAENKLNISYLTLQQLIDLEVSKDFRIEKPNLKSVDTVRQLVPPDKIFEYAVLARPEIKSADLRVRSAERNLDIQRGTLLPTLSLGGSWGTGYSGASKEINTDIKPDTTLVPFGFTQTTHEPVLYPEINYQYRVKSFSDQLKDNNNKSVGFYLSIPIFNGWQAHTNISRAKILKNQAELDLEAQKRDLRKSIEQSYADAIASLKKYYSSLQKLKAQEESFKYTQQKFDVGMMTAFDYNNAKKDLTKAESDLLQAKYDYIFKVTILDFYMGKPISIK